MITLSSEFSDMKNTLYIFFFSFKQGFHIGFFGFDTKAIFGQKIAVMKEFTPKIHKSNIKIAVMKHILSQSF